MYLYNQHGFFLIAILFCSAVATAAVVVAVSVVLDGLRVIMLIKSGVRLLTVERVPDKCAFAVEIPLFDANCMELL